MASEQQSRRELDERAKQGETVVPGGTGGNSLEAQEHLAEGIALDYNFATLFLSFGLVNTFMWHCDSQYKIDLHATWI